MEEPVTSLGRSLKTDARTVHVPLQFSIQSRAACRAVLSFVPLVPGWATRCQAGGVPGRSSAAGQAARQASSARCGGGAADPSCHWFLAPATGAVAGAGVEVHPLAPGAGPDVSAAGPAGGPHHRLACGGRSPLDRPAGRPAVNFIPKTISHAARVFITSPNVAGRASCNVFTLRLCMRPLVPARQVTPPLCLMAPIGGAPGPFADQMGGRCEAGCAGRWTPNRGGKAHRRIPAVQVGRLVRQTVIGFPGEIHHG